LLAWLIQLFLIDWSIWLLACLIDSLIGCVGPIDWLIALCLTAAPL
jgi:hypothetical protein